MVKTIDPPKKSFRFYRQRRQTWNRGYLRERLSYSGRPKGMHNYGTSTVTSIREFDHLIEKKEARVRELTDRVQQLEAPSRTTPVSALPKAVTPRALESTTHAQPYSPVLTDSTVGSTRLARPLGTSSDTRSRKGKAPPVAHSLGI